MSYDQLADHIQRISDLAYQQGERIIKAWYAPIDDPTPEDSPIYQQHIQALRTRCYEEVPRLLMPYLWLPDPRSLDSMSNVLGAAMDHLCLGDHVIDPISDKMVHFANPALTELTAAGDFIQNWTGRAAEAFKAKVIDPFPAVVTNQFLLVATLKGAIEAEQDLWTKARDDIDKIAEATISALEAMDHCGSHEWSLGFTVVAVVAAIALTLADPLDLPLTATFTIDAFGGASWIASASPPKDFTPYTTPQQVTIGGKWPDQILDSLHDAVQKHMDFLNGLTATMAKRLTAIYDAVQATPLLFFADRPELADANRTNITGPEFMGYATA